MPKSTLSIVFSKLETSLGDGFSIAASRRFEITDTNEESAPVWWHRHSREAKDTVCCVARLRLS
jgi:hypothetical protein